MDASTAEVTRVLSIQSHVASGHVGQQAAVFPLQLLGYEVDVVNTVNYSNHAGYGRTGGWKSTSEGLSSIFDVMEKNGLLRPSRIITGYIPNADSLITVSQVIQRLRDRDANIIYVLDPVMGDAGKLYVSADVVPIYRTLLPLATIITPNYFEVEVLTGHPIDSVSSLREALRVLHSEYRVPNVVISSIPLNGSFDLPDRLRQELPYQTGAAASLEPPLLCIASSKEGADNTQLSVVHVIVMPRIPGYFSGVGDLFSALVLGHFHPTSTNPSSSQTPLSYAATRACQTTRALLMRTYLHAMSLPAEDRTNSDEELDAKDADRKIRRMKGRELRLVKERHLISHQAEKSDLRDMDEWVDFWEYL